jgi:hypothetical protein
MAGRLEIVAVSQFDDASAIEENKSVLWVCTKNGPREFEVMSDQKDANIPPPKLKEMLEDGIGLLDIQGGCDLVEKNELRFKR